jgi:hypothetical protein
MWCYVVGRKAVHDRLSLLNSDQSQRKEHTMTAQAISGP